MKIESDEQGMNDLVLVTGGSGFIGEHVVSLLIKQGWAVRILDPNPPAHPPDPHLHYTPGSILDPSAVHHAMEGVSTVIHLAAEARLWVPEKSRYRAVNVNGTEIVLGEARARGIEKFIHVSTEAILRAKGDQGEQLIQPCGDLPPQQTMPGPYTRSKWEAERLVRDAGEKGFCAVIVYPTVPVGPGDRNWTAPTRMIDQFAFAPPPFYLDCRLNLVPVDDVARGIVKALVRGKRGDRFILGGKNMYLSEFLSLIHRCGGRPPPKRKLPYALARTVGLVSQWSSDTLIHKEPLATVEGLSLARTNLWCDLSATCSQLDLEGSSLQDAVTRTLSWIKREKGENLNPG